MFIGVKVVRGAAPMLAILLIAAACSLPGGQKAGGPLDAKRLFATSRPGTVMVVADFKAHLTVPDLKVDEARLSYFRTRQSR